MPDITHAYDMPLFLLLLEKIRCENNQTGKMEKLKREPGEFREGTLIKRKTYHSP